MPIDPKILSDFTDESKKLVGNLTNILDDVEDDFSQAKRLEDYGNQVDRIMGAAKSLEALEKSDHPLRIISEYTVLCKSVAYKTAKISNNEQLFAICISLLMDATETIDFVLDNMHTPIADLRQKVSPEFVDRLRWVSDELNASTGATSEEKLSQGEIDDLMKKLGIN